MGLKGFAWIFDLLRGMLHYLGDLLTRGVFRGLQKVR